VRRKDQVEKIHLCKTRERASKGARTDWGRRRVNHFKNQGFWEEIAASGLLRNMLSFPKRGGICLWGCVLKGTMGGWVLVLNWP